LRKSIEVGEFRKGLGHFERKLQMEGGVAHQLPLLALANLEGAEPGPSPLWATDRRRRGLVLGENGTVLCQVLTFDRSTAKRGLQNTQQDCHQSF